MKKIFLLLILIVAVISCSENDPTDPMNDSDGSTPDLDITITSMTMLYSSNQFAALSTAMNGYQCWIEGDYAYIADSSDGFEIYDISTPTSPTLVISTNTGTDFYGLAVKGNYMYQESDSMSGIGIWDISDKSNPTL